MTVSVPCQGDRVHEGEVREELRTQVAIIGAGPAGLLLGSAARPARASRTSWWNGAAVSTWSSASAPVSSSTASRISSRKPARVSACAREGLVHHGVELRFDGRSHRIALSELADGQADHRLRPTRGREGPRRASRRAGAPLYFDAEVTAIEGLTTGAPPSSRRPPPTGAMRDPLRLRRGVRRKLRRRASGDAGVAHSSLRADVSLLVAGHPRRGAPATEELIYCRHERGFALYSMRSPTRESPLPRRAARRDARRVVRRAHLGRARACDSRPTGAQAVSQGPIVERGITAMRSVVIEPMRYGRLFLAGDAAHIVPPTGAKGMNLALADVRVLARALRAALVERDDALLDAYSDDVPRARVARRGVLELHDPDAAPELRRRLRERGAGGPTAPGGAARAKPRRSSRATTSTSTASRRGSRQLALGRDPLGLGVRVEVRQSPHA